MVTAEEFKMLQPGVQQLMRGQQEQQNSQLEALLKARAAEQERELAQTAQEANIKRTLQLKQQLEAGGKGKRYNIGLSPQGAVNISESEMDPIANFLRVQQANNLQDERQRKAIQDLEDRSTKANTALTVPALQRGEEAIPGLFTGQQDPELKSVGGLKNLIPNFLVSPAESIGLLPQGASKERTALQELQNIKIYDASGKAINEAEMRRIQASLGLNGVFSSEEIIPALRQMGYTAFQKQKQVSAGADPRALQEFKRRGGLAGANSLEELLGQAKQPLAAPQGQPSPQKRMSFEEFKKARREGKL